MTEQEKIANLLYPNCKYSVEEIEKKYPKRQIPAGAEVTRIAPSPTGFLHIGTAYIALIDKLIAGENGVFYFRLEDTDKKREVENSGDIAYDMLCKFDIKPTEGFTGENRPEIGIYGPYRQSDRKEIYEAFAKYLVENGKAFPCFCKKTESIAEIKERREKELEEKEDLESKDICRNLTYEQIKEKIEAGEKFALRLKSSGDANKIIKFTDLAKGEREIRENDKDIVLVKSDGIPVYSFAHAIDDHFMGTTVVVRGEEWFPSLAAHLELFDALGFEHIKYLHAPVLCKLDENGNKRKLSKRKDPEADARYFVKIGVPVESILEYLTNLINSDFEIWRNQNPNAKLCEFPFKISKIGTNNPMFDLVKLCDVSKSVISKMTADEVYEKCLDWAKEFDADFAQYLTSNECYAKQVFAIDRYCAKPRKDIAMWSEVKNYFSYMFKPYFDEKNLSTYEIEDNGEFKRKLKLVLNAYQNVYREYEDKQNWFDDIKTMSSKLGFATDNKLYKQNPENYEGNVADVCMFIRLAITGRKNSPDLFEICKILGVEEVKNRLINLVSLI